MAALGQRLGFVPRRRRPGALWIHAVSVGEVQAAAAVVQRTAAPSSGAADRDDDRHADGRATRAGAVQGQRAASATCRTTCPAPCAASSIGLHRGAALILETEIWPTLYAALGRRHIPLRARQRAPVRHGPSSATGAWPRCSADAARADMLIGAQTSGATPSDFVAIGAAAGARAGDGQRQVRPRDPGRDDRSRAGAARAMGRRRVRSGSPAARTKARKRPHCGARRRACSAMPMHCWCWCRVIRSVSKQSATLLRERGVRFVQRSRGERAGAARRGAS